MDEIDLGLEASQGIESRLASGFSALEHGDLEGARAALQDVYDESPTHPSLPLLAAGIRRARPKRVPWRTAVLMAAVVAVAGYVFLSRRPPRVLPAQPITSIASVPEMPAPATGTAGQLEDAVTPEPPRHDPPRHDNEAPIGDDALIREAIARFVTAYRSRWTPLAFQRCDLTQQLTTATATCRIRSTGDVPDVGANDVWTFRLQKSATTWKILSVQPSATMDHP